MGSMQRMLARLNGPPPDEEPVRLGWRGWGLVGGVFVVGLMVFGSYQFSRPNLVGSDGYFHTQLAALYAEDGVPDRLEWTQASVHRDRFVDKEFLFHVVLIPFLGQDRQTGPKVLTVILAAFSLALLVWIAIRLGAPVPWLWAALLLSAGVLFALRMSLTRPHLLSIPLTLLASYLMLRRQALGLFVVALLYPLSYTALHMLPCLVLVYWLACALKAETVPWRLLVAVAAGTLLGALLHPHRAFLLTNWIHQNVEVVTNAFALPGQLAVEFHPPDGRLLIWDVGLVLFGSLAACLALFVVGVQARLQTVFYFVAAVGYLALFLNIRRFAEYWAPFSILFIACAAADLLANLDWKGWLARHRLAGPALAGGLLIALLVFLLQTVLLTQALIAHDDRPTFDVEGAWIERHVPDGQTVFACDTFTNSFLIHHAPSKRYLVVLDPTYLIGFDPELARTWFSICGGRQPEPALEVASRFGAHWALIEAEWRRALRSARGDPRFVQRFRGPQGTVFWIRPDLAGLAVPLVVSQLTPGAGTGAWAAGLSAIGRLR
jgi:hypothetical protein